MFTFWFLACKAHGILVPQTGSEPVPFCGGKQTINHWSTGEVGSVKDMSTSKSSSVLRRTDPAPKKGEDFIENVLPMYNLKKLDFVYKQIVWDKVAYVCILFLWNGLWSLFLSSQLAYCIPGSMTAYTHTHKSIIRKLLVPKWQVSKLRLK